MTNYLHLRQLKRVVLQKAGNTNKKREATVTRICEMENLFTTFNPFEAPISQVCFALMKKFLCRCLT